MRGHIRKRRTWEFIVDIGPHPVTGRRRQKSKSGFATKREAESALHEFIRYVAGGGDPSPERTSLGEWLSRWLEYPRARGIRSRTVDGYEGYIRREIVPVIGGLELAKVRPGHVRAVLAGCSSGGCRPPPAPRSEASSAPRSDRPSRTGSSPSTRCPR